MILYYILNYINTLFQKLGTDNNKVTILSSKYKVSKFLIYRSKFVNKLVIVFTLNKNFSLLTGVYGIIPKKYIAGSAT